MILNPGLLCKVVQVAHCTVSPAAPTHIYTYLGSLRKELWLYQERTLWPQLTPQGPTAESCPLCQLLLQEYSTALPEAVSRLMHSSRDTPSACPTNPSAVPKARPGPGVR